MLTAEEARAEFSYSPDTGELRWKRSGHRRRRDLIAGSRASDGYRQVSFRGKVYRAHRLIWLIVHGKWPTGEIDHINRDGYDNRLCNLRDVSPAENSANRRLQNGASGFRGVYRDGFRWRATICHRGRKMYLGKFDDPSEAHAAYARAFREIHGTDLRL